MAFNSSFQDTWTVRQYFKPDTPLSIPHFRIQHSLAFTDVGKITFFQFLILGYSIFVVSSKTNSTGLSIPHFRILVKKRFQCSRTLKPFNSSFQDTRPQRLPRHPPTHLSIPHFRIRTYYDWFSCVSSAFNSSFQDTYSESFWTQVVSEALSIPHFRIQYFERVRSGHHSTLSIPHFRIHRCI